jgi:succinoglycan biosynthesis transport protein ExoP
MQERSLLDYWMIVYRRRSAIYIVIATSIAVALLIGEFVTPTYEARATLYLPSKLAPVSYVGTGSTSSLARDQVTPISQELAYKPYLGILKSVQLAQIVQAQYPTKRLIKLLRSDVDFEITDELIIRIYSRDHDPKLAADVANAYVDGFNKILVESSQAQVDQEPAYITSALTRVNEELQNAEDQLKRFEEKHHLANLEAELTALSTNKAALENKADDALVQIVAIRGKKAALVQEMKREGQDLQASEVATNSPLIQNLRVQLADTLTKLSEMEVELGRNNVQVIAQRKRKDELEQQISDEVRRWFSSPIKPVNSHLEELRQQLINVTIEEQRLQAASQGNVQALARLSDRLRGFPAIKASGAELNANVERLRKTQAQLQVGLTEAQLQTARQMNMVVRLDRADAPAKPAFPIWWLNSLIALFSGTVAGIGYAFFLNYVEETRNVRTIRLVREILGRNDTRPA